MSQNVNVNLTPGGYPKEFHVSQYDVGRQLVAKVVDSTGDYSIPSGATAVLVGTKPSGFGFTLNGTVSGSTVTFSTTATVTAEYGRIPCEIRITNGSTILGTANCMLIVEESPHPEGTTDGDGEVIVNQITLLLEQITQQADRAVAASEAAQASETAAAASEANAATSESNAAASEATALSAKDDAVAAKTAAQASEQAAAESAAEAEATLGSYAKVGGEYDGMTVGTAKQLLSDSTTTDTEPYIYRQTAGDGDREEVEEVVGGTVAWNQLVQNGNFESTDGWVSDYATLSVSGNVLTYTSTMVSGSAAILGKVLGTVSGHKYLVSADIKCNNTLPASGVWLGTGGYDGITRTVSELSKWTNISGVFVRGTGGNDRISLYPRSTLWNNGDTCNIRNIVCFDLTAMFGSAIADYIYSLEQANAGAGVAWFRNYFPNDYYPYDPGTLRSVEGVSAHVTVGFNLFDKDSSELLQNKITTANGNVITLDTAFTTPFIRVLPNTTYYCNHILGSSSTSSAYVEFDSDKNYIGVGSVGYGGNVAIGGKEATFTTSKNTRYIKFNGSLNAIDETNLNLSDQSRNGEYEPYTKHTYPLDSSLTLRGVPKLVDGKLAFDGDVYPPSGEVQRRYGLRAYQSGDESLADAITDGANTVYKLATPTTETADPYTSIQICDPNGTEEWTDERAVQIPVGNVTKYHANLKEKLEDLPAIPSAPSANGTYTLKATVSGGAVTYQWVNG